MPKPKLKIEVSGFGWIDAVKTPCGSKMQLSPLMATQATYVYVDVDIC